MMCLLLLPWQRIVEWLRWQRSSDWSYHDDKGHLTLHNQNSKDCGRVKWHAKSLKCWLGWLASPVVVEMYSTGIYQSSCKYISCSIDLCLSHFLLSEKTYTRCMRYIDCNYMTLATRYTLPDFTFSCCQSKLCNGQEKSAFQKFLESLG